MEIGRIGSIDRASAGLEKCVQSFRIMSDYVSSLAVGSDGAVWVGTARFNERGQGLNILDSRGTPTNPDERGRRRQT